MGKRGDAVGDAQSVDGAAEKLRYRWIKADHETRKDFMSWIIDQRYA
ncbi:MAG: DUF2057 family protein [Candidatus Thiodiazotropha sp.]